MAMATPQSWPALPLEEWSDTFGTLHMWMQIVGKVRLVQSPWTNHSWHVTLYVTSRGLTTSQIPYGDKTFQIDFDFIDHRLIVQTSDGRSSGFALEPQSVATFYARLLNALEAVDLEVSINKLPCEVVDAIPFDQNESNRSYDADYATRFWRILVQCDRLFREFRARFVGKCSPVHLFWGAGDICVTRFSGRRAPEHPGGIPNLADWVTREAYSHEVSSAGFWPGGGDVPYPAFYAYAYPEPEGFSKAPVAPEGAFYSTSLHEFILPYDVARQSQSPDETVLAFLQSTYEAAANAAAWDRQALEQTQSIR
jgi:hypothetical protein